MHGSTWIGDGHQNRSLDQSSKRAERSRLSLKARTKGTPTQSNSEFVGAVGLHSSDPQVGDSVPSMFINDDGSGVDGR
jgi:hypothetical protein